MVIKILRIRVINYFYNTFYLNRLNIKHNLNNLFLAKFSCKLKNFSDELSMFG